MSEFFSDHTIAKLFKGIIYNLLCPRLKAWHAGESKWKDHINNLEQLRSTIGLRGYGQRDPLNEYKNEAFGLFEELINNLKIDVSKIFSRMRLREKQNLR